MAGDAWVAAQLEALRARGLMRSLRALPGPGGTLRVGGRTLLNFGSNDYLDLARDERVIAAARGALESAGAGAGASRLLAGSLLVHQRLEFEIAEHKGYPAALLFGSGFLANAGAMPALVGRGDSIFIDRLAHASMVDAALLSRAAVRRFRHNDVEHLAALVKSAAGAGRKLIATESIFSMDGDRAPLAAIAAVAREHDAMLLVDEAHATGVFGPQGSGCVAEEGIRDAVTICMGTLSKALGSYGGFVACSETVRDWLVNRARTFVYSTALPPAAAAAAMEALSIVKRTPELGVELLRRANLLRERLNAAGLSTGNSVSPIIPLAVGDTRKALALVERLRPEGIIAFAIRPPTVPAGTERLRLSVTLAHTEEDLEMASKAIARSAAAEGIR